MCAGLALVGWSCDDGDDAPEGDAGATGEPSLLFVGPTDCDATLVVSTRDEVADGTARTTTVTVQGTAAVGGHIAPGTPVELSAVGDEPSKVWFASSIAAGAMDRAVSTNLQFNGRTVSDQVVCIGPGSQDLQATVGATEAERPTTIHCVRPEDLPPECGSVDAGPPDAAADAAPDAAPDAGTDAAPVAAWNLGFQQLPAGDEVIRLGDFVDLTFTAESEGQPIVGLDVDFALLGGPPGAALGASEGQTDDAGEVVVRLQAGRARGPARVQATATYEDVADAADSQAIQIVGGVPSGHGFTFTCDEAVIPAFTTRFADPDDWRLVPGACAACTAQVTDRFLGRVEANTRVLFESEAGNVDAQLPVDDEGRATTSWCVGEPAPTDVEPQDYETDAGFAGPFNPRDGLVRAVAIVHGEEAFTDMNGNGIWEPAIDFQEPTDDLPEAFVDKNDNGRWDDGEPFTDADEDEAWSPPNGDWDAETEIWTSATVLWVGDLAGDDPCDRLTYTCVAGGGCEAGADGAPPRIVAPGGAFEVTADFTDVNGNCLAGFGDGAASLAIAGSWAVRGAEANVPLRDHCFGGPRGLPVGGAITWTVESRLEPGAMARDAEDALTVGVDYRRAGDVMGRARCVVDVETALAPAE